VSDLENVICQLEKDLDAARLKNEEEMKEMQHKMEMTVDSAKMEKEHVEHSLAGTEWKMTGQEKRLRRLLCMPTNGKNR